MIDTGKYSCYNICVEIFSVKKLDRDHYSAEFETGRNSRKRKRERRAPPQPASLCHTYW